VRALLLPAPKENASDGDQDQISFPPAPPLCRKGGACLENGPIESGDAHSIPASPEICER